MWSIEIYRAPSSVWSPSTWTVFVMWCRKAIVCMIYETYELRWYSKLQRGSFLSSVCFDDLLHCWFIAFSAGSWCYESYCRIFIKYRLYSCVTHCACRCWHPRLIRMTYYYFSITWEHFWTCGMFNEKIHSGEHKLKCNRKSSCTLTTLMLKSQEIFCSICQVFF